MPAPGLAEVAAAWWDRDEVPVVRWSEEGDRFTLALADGSDAILLCVLDAPAPDPGVVAAALADGLAGCDFPPTGSAADPTAVRATLRSRLGRSAPTLSSEVGDDR